MRRISSLVCGAIVAIAAIGCERESVAPEMRNAPERETVREDPLPATPAPAASDAGIQTASLMLVTSGVPHPYVADGTGHALYYVEGDKDGAKCTGPCLAAWPPFLVDASMPSGDANLQAGMIGTLQRADGATQVTYNQHPLYRYAADAGAGRSNGNGVKDQWGHWHQIGANGEPLPLPEPAGPEQ